MELTIQFSLSLFSGALCLFFSSLSYFYVMKQLYIFALNPKRDGDEYFSRIEGIAEEGRHVQLYDLPTEEQTREVAKRGCHVLLDMMGYTEGARTEIFAAKVAPVQVSRRGARERDEPLLSSPLQRLKLLVLLLLFLAV